MEITKANCLKGEITIPGDKSISHRSVMFGALAEGLTEITNFLKGADCLATIEAFRKMGVTIEDTDSVIRVHGKGLQGLTKPSVILDMGNSGTTTRLISGILAAQNFSCDLTGDASIQTRPMGRIIEPLTQMGANITSVRNNGCAPLHIEGAPLHGIHYQSSVASAQVKSAILLAGLYAEGETSVTEPHLSRNHTELMLAHFGADITSKDNTARISQCRKLTGQKIDVPGDISSAAYFIAAGLLVPGSDILIRNVGINPTRSGILEVCQQMGAQLELLNISNASGEPVADIHVRTSDLHGTVIEGDIIPTLIDELPVIAVMASQAEGTTVIRDAHELKVKESDRIEVVTKNLKAMGCDVTPTDDGMIINGRCDLHGAEIDTRHDHRIAMSFAVAGLTASSPAILLDSDVVTVSYPDFYESINKLKK